jgi:hypothetical protein
MNKKNIRHLLEWKKEIEGLNDVFNNPLFLDLLDLLFWAKDLEREGTFTKEDLYIIDNWNKITDKYKRDKIVNELYKTVDASF